MKSTLDLLAKAAAKAAPMSERQLSMKLGHSPTALSMARRRGSLSPIVAGQLAELAGEDIEHWMAIAAIEAVPKTRATEHLRRIVTMARNSWITRLFADTCRGRRRIALSH